MATFATAKQIILNRIDKAEGDFYDAIADMDLENLTVEDDMLAEAKKLSEHVPDVKAQVNSIS